MRTPVPLGAFAFLLVALAAPLIVQGLTSAPASAEATAPATPVPVTPHNFIRAETDLFFRRAVQDDAFAKLRHSPENAFDRQARRRADEPRK